jgi:hypothetical protein
LFYLSRMAESQPNSIAADPADPASPFADSYAQWLRIEVDALLRDYPDVSVAALASSLEGSADAYEDGPERAAELVAEMRGRVDADLRFWPASDRKLLPASSANVDPLEGDDIPW